MVQINFNNDNDNIADNHWKKIENSSVKLKSIFVYTFVLICSISQFTNIYDYFMYGDIFISEKKNMGTATLSEA